MPIYDWSGKPVRLLGITLSGFDTTENQQLSFADLLESSGAVRQDERLEAVVDHIRAKYGQETILRAALLRKKPKVSNPRKVRRNTRVPF